MSTVMWLLPVAFMIHDFEEIIMMRPWYLKNGAYLKARFPRVFDRMSATAGLSTPAFALVVLGEFVVLSAATLACVELGAYPAWAAIAVIFLVHNLIHVGSFFVVGRYVPFVITGVITSACPIYALATLYGGGYLVPQDVLAWLAVALVPAGAGFFVLVRAAARFDRWLERWSVPG